MDPECYQAKKMALAHINVDAIEKKARRETDSDLPQL